MFRTLQAHRPPSAPPPAWHAWCVKHRRLALAALAALVLTGCSGTSSGSEKGLDDPAKKDIAMRLMSSAENSTLDWKAQYAYVEDIGDGRGYTAG
ncbi:chitosanase, partial [Streptomyces sp. For3]|nr:chitosanase [Streptomyces silvae]